MSPQVHPDGRACAMPAVIKRCGIVAAGEGALGCGLHDPVMLEGALRLMTMGMQPNSPRQGRAMQRVMVTLGCFRHPGDNYQLRENPGRSGDAT